MMYFTFIAFVFNATRKTNTSDLFESEKKYISVSYPTYVKDSNAAEVCCTLIGYTMYNNSKNGEKGINETKTTDWA